MESNTEEVKAYLLKSRNATFEYDFTQHNCAFYIAKALSHSRDNLEFKRDGLFITPVSTLRWARTEGIISSGTYLPSTQLKALNEYETLSVNDQDILINYLSRSNVLNQHSIDIETGKALSAIAEYMIPREADPSKRNYLFSIKREFPSDSSVLGTNSDDPSRSIGPSSISALISPNKKSFIFTISPGIVRLENEATSFLHNATIETIRSDILANNAGNIRLEEFHLVRMESNQPSGYLRDGFTQAFDISYTNYRTYIDDNYKEAKILFGRGFSWLYGGSTISLLPIASIIKSWGVNGASSNGNIAIRLREYKKLNKRLITAFQIEQSINHAPELRQTMNLDLIDAINCRFNISLHIRRVEGMKKSSALLGIGITVSF